MKRPLILLLVVISLCLNRHCCFGQSDSLLYDNIYKRAHSAYRSGRFVEAANGCRSALKNTDLTSKNILRFRLLQGAIAAGTGDLDSAIYFSEMGLKNAEEDDPKTLVTLVYLSIYNGRLAHYDESIRYARVALKFGFDDKTSNLKALNFNTLGLVYRNLSRYDSASFYLKKSLKIRRQIGDERGMADCYNNLAAIKVSLGYFNSALEYHKHALDIRKRVFGDMHSNTAYSYNNIGHCYLNINSYDSAEHYFLKSLEVKKQVAGANHSSLVTTLTNLGEVNTAKRDYESAQKYYRESIKLGKESWTVWHPKVSDSYVGLADLFVNQEAFDMALMYYDSAKLICNKLFDLPHKRTSFILYRKGHAFLKKGHLTRALRAVEAGIQANLVNDEVALDNVLMVDLLAKRGEIAHALYKEKAEPDYLNLSIESYNTCYKYLNEGRKLLNNRPDRVRMSGLSKEVSAALLKVLFQEQKNIKQQFYQLAWETIEKSKINELQFSFYDDQDRFLSGLPQELVEYDKLLTDSITNIKYGLQAKGENFDLARKERLFTYNQKQDSLMGVYKIQFPKYYQLKYGHAPLSLEKVQSKLQESTAVLNYFYKGETTYLLVATSNEKYSFELKSENVKRLITGLYQSLSKRSTDFNAHAYAIYEALFRPVEESISDDISKLVISPDGILTKVPFEVLTVSKERSSYLLEHFDISYQYSSSTSLSNSFNNSGHSLELAAYAPSYSNDSLQGYLREKHVAPLAWNKEEVSVISKTLGGRKFIDNATETQFKRYMNDAEVIHLAMHSILNKEQPLQSHFVFDEDSSESEDGALYIYEVLNMDMKAKMAVLSGCQTSDGKVEQGEGLISLGYAFTAAGVPTTVTSQWSVDDKSTSLLMKYFYENLARGMSKSQALRSAKLKFIDGTSPAYAHPFYWGAFVLYGENTSMRNHSNMKVNLAVILGTILFFSLLLGVYKMKT